MNFKIYTNFNLNLDDIKTLNLLYLPLIGDDSLTLYTFLHSLIDRMSLEGSFFQKEEILDLLGYKSIKFNKSLAKLEGINLVRTFVKEDYEVVFLLAPFTPKNFLKDTVLGHLLEERIGEENYKKLLELFIIPTPDLKDYKEITKTFGEVFSESHNIKYDKISDNIYGRRPNRKSLINNTDFDFDLFISKIDLNHLKDGLTDEFRKQIESTSLVYSFNLEQMTNLFNDSVDKNGYYNYDLFKKKVQSLYNFLHKKVNSKLSNDDMVNKLDNMNAVTLVKSLMGDNYPNLVLQKVNDLYININLPRGIINLMIILVYAQKENIPAISYFEKMASSWQNDGIYTTEDAVNKYVKGQLKTKSKKNNKDIELEDWQIAGMEDIMKGFR